MFQLLKTLTSHACSVSIFEQCLWVKMTTIYVAVTACN